MTIRRNDLAVFDMILMMTKCPDSSAASFVQLGQKRNAKDTDSYQVCNTNDGGMELHFDDPKLQAKVERVMTPDARRKLRELLGQALPLKARSFLEVGEKMNKQPSSGSVNTTTPGFPTAAPDTSPVAEEPHPEGQWKKCTDGTPNCGLLHDLMSIEWGKFRDSFDELATEMTHDQDVYDKLMGNMNEQLVTINDARTKHMETLAATISEINADTEETNEKDDEKRDLQEEYDRVMATFSAKCTEILFTRICGVRRVRNNIMWDSTVSPPSKISDCDFTDWYPKDGKCFNPRGMQIDCDDTCPQPDPYACGGLETMIRDVVVTPNEYGMKCPPLARQKKCNQYKCPVDCVQSEWSGWSKCTKECESGVTVRTRSILTKAKNGGRACDTVQEEEPCNTGSCDRDCTLDDWTEWSPCSMACGGGMTEHFRKVLIPIRGEGKCPKATALGIRFDEKSCNTLECIGDEICVAHQDLVMAIDASGSLRESGFEVVRTFSANLTARYMDMYYGKEMMKVGVVQFGNGQLVSQPDGSTVAASALYIQGLTSDLGLVRTKIEELQWQRGFTNMAQAFQQADIMLGQTGRAEAQSAVLVITDGKYSMAFQTAEKSRELKDKNIMVYMAVISEGKDTTQDELKKWASQPWETNFVRIPGLQALEFNSDIFTQRVIAKFCPHSISPTRQLQSEEELQCVKIREGGEPDQACAAGRIHPQGADSPAVCAEMAREQGGLAFMLGQGVEAGKCAVLSMQMTDQQFSYFQDHRRDPECPGGGWEANPFWDVYACKALEDPCGPGSGFGHLDFAGVTGVSGNLVGGPMTFTHIGYTPDGSLDLEVSAGSDYQPKDANKNGMKGAFGQINIKTCTSTDVTFNFKQGGASLTMEKFEVTFFDLDTGGKPNKMWEALSASDYDEMIQAPAPFYSVSGDTVKATIKGVGADNPSDPMMLTPEQISRSVGFYFSDKSSFTVTLDVPCPTKQYNGGRNYFFAFHSSLTPCRPR
jgi:hypothetical protein